VNAAELLVPALRWDAEREFEGQRELIESALAHGVGGFIFFGGAADAVRDLTAELHERSPHALLIGADLERGAGQQFAECTGLPPLAALGWLGDAATMRRAGELTAREARALGVNWVYAPVLDLDIEPDNPIVGTRAIGSDPGEVGSLGREWIEGCQAQHVLACGKHFPGHGRTTADSHAELPVVNASAELLEETDLRPFAKAVRAGVASLMSAHVWFPALDDARGPATLSRAILTGLLRERLGFQGLVVTDALIMAGVLEEGEEHASVRALAAGCDLLLYPENLDTVARGISRAVESGELSSDALQRSMGRRREWARWAQETGTLTEDSGDATPAWARDVACGVVHVLRGELRDEVRRVEITVVDDDVGGPYPPPSREPFTTRLRELGVEVGGGRGAIHVVALFGDIRAWKGRPGYSAGALESVAEAIQAREGAAVIVQFSHPRLAQAIGGTAPIVCAWGGESAMQRAAAEWLVHRCRSV
jgi:beta-glucosidase-like glycosyl hydrolase